VVATARGGGSRKVAPTGQNAKAGKTQVGRELLFAAKSTGGPGDKKKKKVTKKRKSFGMGGFKKNRGKTGWGKRKKTWRRRN